MAVAPIGQMQTTSEPFVWGQGGKRMTPADIAIAHQLAQQQMATGADYSPVQSWTQGLARLANGAIGGIRERRADKAADQNAAYSQSITQSLLGSSGAPSMSPGGEVPASGGNPSINPAIAQALSSPYVDDATRELAMTQYKTQNRPPLAPHYWETNNGSVGVIGPDGQPRIVYDDPTPKINWISADDPLTGQKILTPTVNGMPVGQGAQSGAAPPPATLPPDFDFGQGGQTPPASGGFR